MGEVIPYQVYWCKTTTHFHCSWSQCHWLIMLFSVCLIVFKWVVVAQPWKTHKLGKTQHRRRKIHRAGEENTEQGKCCRKKKKKRQILLIVWNGRINSLLKAFKKLHLGIRKAFHARDDGVSALSPVHPRKILQLVLPLVLEMQLSAWTYSPGNFVSSSALLPALTTAETPCATNTPCWQDVQSYQYWSKKLCPAATQCSSIIHISGIVSGKAWRDVL